MCMKCQVVFNRHFGTVGSDHADFILWNMTAYPFASPEVFSKQVEDLAAIVRPHQKGFLRRLNAEIKRQEEEDTRILRELSAKENLPA